MQSRVAALGELGVYKYVVILSLYQRKLLLSRHKDRDTWETQGGHIEPGETPLQAAQRELYEESGAAEFMIEPAFDYQAGDSRAGEEHSAANGMVFIAKITELGALPQSEMAEVRLFDGLPENLTYPGITPVLYRRAREMRLLG